MGTYSNVLRLIKRAESRIRLTRIIHPQITSALKELKKAYQIIDETRLHFKNNNQQTKPFNHGRRENSEMLSFNGKDKTADTNNQEVQE